MENGEWRMENGEWRMGINKEMIKERPALSRNLGGDMLK